MQVIFRIVRIKLPLLHLEKKGGIDSRILVGVVLMDRPPELTTSKVGNSNHKLHEKCVG